MDTTFAIRLATALEIRNMSAAELSKRTNTPESAISQYKKGAFEPKQKRLELFANTLRVSIPWLMGYDVPMERNEDIKQCENYEKCKKKDIKPLISKILQLDERDKGKISERVDILLEDDKYNLQKELKHA